MEVPAPEAIIGSIEENLISRGEALAVRDERRKITQSLLNSGFEILAEDLNLLNRFFGCEAIFTEDDFRGSAVYPGSSMEEAHEKAHLVPVLGFGVIVPENRWEKIAEKLGDCPGGRGMHIERTLFAYAPPGRKRQKSLLGLESTGISLVAGDDNGRIEYSALFNDMGIYNDLAGHCFPIFAKKLDVPLLTVATFDYRTMRELCASASLCRKPEEASRKAIEDIERCIDSALFMSCGDRAGYERARGMYNGVLGSVIESALPAARSLQSLRQELGPMLTPIMFSVGASESCLELEEYLSPLKSIAALDTYIKNGAISKAQLEAILRKKGYMQQYQKDGSIIIPAR